MMNQDKRKKRIANIAMSMVIVLIILSGVLARRLSRRIVDPLNSLDLEHPLDNDAYEELSPI